MGQDLEHTPDELFRNAASEVKQSSVCYLECEDYKLAFEFIMKLFSKFVPVPLISVPKPLVTWLTPNIRKIILFIIVHNQNIKTLEQQFLGTIIKVFVT